MDTSELDNGERANGVPKLSLTKVDGRAPPPKTEEDLFGEVADEDMDTIREEEGEEEGGKRSVTGGRLPKLSSPRLGRTPDKSGNAVGAAAPGESPIQEEPQTVLITALDDADAEVLRLEEEEEDEEGYVGDGEEGDDYDDDDDDDEQSLPSPGLYQPPLPRGLKNEDTPHPRTPRAEEKEEKEQKDIFGDDGWDTDLEPEPGGEFLDAEHDVTGRNQYARNCQAMGVVPVSYFMRHIQDQHLVMRCHGLGVHGTKAIARALKENVHVEKLDLTGNWMEPEGGRYMAKMLSENDFINEVSLADNKLASEGAQYVLQMLKTNITLKSVNLSGNGIEDYDTESIADMLDNNKFLSELILAHNQFTTAGGVTLGPAIAENAILDVLDLSWNQLRGKGALAVAQGVKENVRLKKVNLSWNGFGQEAGPMLAEIIQHNSALLEIDISGCRLDAQCAVLIGKGLASNDFLRVLKMGNNPITTAGAVAVIQGVQKNETSVLCYLDLTDIAVERTFLEIMEQLQETRDIRVVHGQLLWSGNTMQDLGSICRNPQIKDPLVLMDDGIKVRDLRLIEIVERMDESGQHAVTQDQFILALRELGVTFPKTQLEQIVKKLGKNKEGKISFADYVQLLNEKATEEVKAS